VHDLIEGCRVLAYLTPKTESRDIGYFVCRGELAEVFGRVGYLETNGLEQH